MPTSEYKKKLAEEILYLTLTKKTEDLGTIKNLLIQLKGEEKAKYAHIHLANFIEKDNFTPGKIRPNNEHAPKDIENAKDEIEEDSKNYTDFKEMQSILLQEKLPDLKIYKNIFGAHAEKVQKLDQKFIEVKNYSSKISNTFRFGGTPKNTHPGAISMIVKHLGFDKEIYGDDPNHFVTIAKLHDGAEDGINLIRDDKGKTYTLERYVEFEDEFIPETVREHHRLITNLSDILLKNILNNKEYGLNKSKDDIKKEDIINALEKVYDKKIEYISDYANDLAAFIETVETNDKYIYETVKFASYLDYYIDKVSQSVVWDRLLISNNSKKKIKKLLTSDFSDVRILEIKQIDSRENNINKDYVPLDNKIKAIIKQCAIGEAGLNVKINWDPLIRKSNELIQASRNEVWTHLTYMIMHQKDSDRYMSVVPKTIKAFQSVFYEDKKHPMNLSQLKFY